MKKLTILILGLLLVSLMATGVAAKWTSKTHPALQTVFTITIDEAGEPVEVTANYLTANSKDDKLKHQYDTITTGTPVAKHKGSRVYLGEMAVEFTEGYLQNGAVTPQHSDGFSTYVYKLKKKRHCADGDYLNKDCWTIRYYPEKEENGLHYERQPSHYGTIFKVQGEETEEPTLTTSSEFAEELLEKLEVVFTAQNPGDPVETFALGVQEAYQDELFSTCDPISDAMYCTVSYIAGPPLTTYYLLTYNSDGESVSVYSSDENRNKGENLLTLLVYQTFSKDLLKINVEKDEEVFVPHTVNFDEIDEDVYAGVVTNNNPCIKNLYLYYEHEAQYEAELLRKNVHDFKLEQLIVKNPDITYVYKYTDGTVSLGSDSIAVDDCPNPAPDPVFEDYTYTTNDFKDVSVKFKETRAGRGEDLALHGPILTSTLQGNWRVEFEPTGNVGRTKGFEHGTPTTTEELSVAYKKLTGETAFSYLAANNATLAGLNDAQKNELLEKADLTVYDTSFSRGPRWAFRVYLEPGETGISALQKKHAGGNLDGKIVPAIHAYLSQITAAPEDKINNLIKTKTSVFTDEEWTALTKEEKIKAYILDNLIAKWKIGTSPLEFKAEAITLKLPKLTPANVQEKFASMTIVRRDSYQPIGDEKKMKSLEEPVYVEFTAREAVTLSGADSVTTYTGIPGTIIYEPVPNNADKPAEGAPTKWVPSKLRVGKLEFTYKDKKWELKIDDKNTWSSNSDISDIEPKGVQAPVEQVAATLEDTCAPGSWCQAIVKVTLKKGEEYPPRLPNSMVFSLTDDTAGDSTFGYYGTNRFVIDEDGEIKRVSLDGAVGNPTHTADFNKDKTTLTFTVPVHIPERNQQGSQYLYETHNVKWKLYATPDSCKLKSNGWTYEDDCNRQDTTPVASGKLWEPASTTFTWPTATGVALTQTTDEVAGEYAIGELGTKEDKKFYPVTINGKEALKLKSGDGNALPAFADLVTYKVAYLGKGPYLNELQTATEKPEALPENAFYLHTITPQSAFILKIDEDAFLLTEGNEYKFITGSRGYCYASSNSGLKVHMGDAVTGLGTDDEWQFCRGNLFPSSVVSTEGDFAHADGNTICWKGNFLSRIWDMSVNSQEVKESNGKKAATITVTRGANKAGEICWTAGSKSFTWNSLGETDLPEGDYFTVESEGWPKYTVAKAESTTTEKDLTVGRNDFKVFADVNNDDNNDFVVIPESFAALYKGDKIVTPTSLTLKILTKEEFEKEETRVAEVVKAWQKGQPVPTNANIAGMAGTSERRPRAIGGISGGIPTSRSKLFCPSTLKQYAWVTQENFDAQNVAVAVHRGDVCPDQATCEAWAEAMRFPLRGLGEQARCELRYGDLCERYKQMPIYSGDQTKWSRAVDAMVSNCKNEIDKEFFASREVARAGTQPVVDDPVLQPSGVCCPKEVVGYNAPPSYCENSFNDAKIAVEAGINDYKPDNELCNGINKCVWKSGVAKC